MKPALLIIDLQKAWYFGEMKASMDRASHEINEVLKIFRKQEWPVIWIQHIDKNSRVEPGLEIFEFIDALKPMAKEYRVDKEYMNSFNQTNLLEIVKKENVDTVLVTGFCAEYCVLSTYRGALDHDLVPILLKNGIASGNKDNLRFVENLCELVTSKTFATLISGIKSQPG